MSLQTARCTCVAKTDNSYPEDFNIESFPYLRGNLLTAAVIKLGGPAVGMAGDSLSGFKGVVIFQKIRDAGRPE